MTSSAGDVVTRRPKVRWFTARVGLKVAANSALGFGESAVDAVVWQDLACRLERQTIL